MKKQPKYLTRKKSRGTLVLILAMIAGLLCILVCGMAFLLRNRATIQEMETSAPMTAHAPTEAPTPTATSMPQAETVTETENNTTPTEAKMLEDMAALHEENSDLFGWLTIAGTKIDYPVMYTPEEPEKYLHLNFEEGYSLRSVLHSQRAQDQYVQEKESRRQAAAGFSGGCGIQALLQLHRYGNR